MSLTEEELWSAVQHLDRDLLDPSTPTEVIDSAAMAMGLDPSGLRAEGVALATVLLGEYASCTNVRTGMSTILYFDLETSSFSPSKGEILEVGAILPDGTHYQALVESSQPWDPQTRLFHDGTGFLAEWETSTRRPQRDVEAELVRLLAGQSYSLAGFSPHFDLDWVRAKMPEFARLLSHRVYDVSTISRFAEAELGIHTEKPCVTHRALEDCLAARRYHDEIVAKVKAGG